MPDVMVRQYATAYEQSIGESTHPELTNTAIAKCYHKLKLYDKALQYYEKAIEDNFDNSESYFYTAICLLKGQKAFLTLRPVIDKIEEYINAAISIEPRGIYYYLWAYIKNDYYSRKSFNTSPTYQELLRTADSNGVSPFDIQQFFSMLGVTRPDSM
jgi:tetratricopeptide (TPR) repeat protein